MLAFWNVLSASSGFEELVDRIVAVVNEHVITLTDIKIADKFGIYEEELNGKIENRFLLILERMINQKIVIDATSEDIFVKEEELESALKKMAAKFDLGEFEKKLDEFGLDQEDLKNYLKEAILYQKILSRRFGRGVSVSLEEIVSYYRNTYIPSQNRKGIESRPMMELLDDIELRIRQEKTRKQIVDWINNLKKQAEIEIKSDILKNIEKSEMEQK
ncbi:MAG: hypothetical protein ACETWK_04475 [Candidatus Aminicenantaceae bacterium]